MRATEEMLPLKRQKVAVHQSNKGQYDVWMYVYVGDDHSNERTGIEVVDVSPGIVSYRWTGQL